MMDWQQYLAGATAITKSLSSFVFTAFSVLVGVLFIYRGIKRIIDHGKGGNPHEKVFGYVATNLATGVALIQFSFFVDSLSESLYGGTPEKANQVLTYLPDNIKGTAMLNTGVEIAAMWVSVIGVISIFRGIVLWNSLANGNNQGGSAGWKGLWHIVFGILAANIAGTVKLFFAAEG